jgi:hypothetical protein
VFVNTEEGRLGREERDSKNARREKDKGRERRKEKTV